MTASAGPVLEKLHEEYGGLVDFLTLYVREAHPGDVYPQPRSFDQKLQHAQDFRRREKLGWPVLVDDLQGGLHRALDSKPNSIYLVDRDGRVAYRQLWAGDQGPLRRAIEKLLAGASEPLGERESRLIPMMRGVGKMDETLRSAGESARRDLRREMPPLFGLSLLAGFFRPLSPLGRTLAAGGTALGALALIGVGGYFLFRGMRTRRQTRSQRALGRILQAGAPVLIASRGLRKDAARKLLSARKGATRSLRDASHGLKATTRDLQESLQDGGRRALRNSRKAMRQVRELRMQDLRDLRR